MTEPIVRWLLWGAVVVDVYVVLILALAKFCRMSQIDERERINVEFIYPPIPLRQFDYQATFTNYEPGDVMGHGATREEAIKELLERAEERGAIRKG